MSSEQGRPNQTEASELASTSEPDILHWLRNNNWQEDFDPADLAQGIAQQRRQGVHILNIQGNHIRALCRSDAGKPHRQSIFLGKSGLRLHCACSCPVAMNCAHAAAVIAQVLSDDSATQGGCQETPTASADPAALAPRNDSGGSPPSSTLSLVPTGPADDSAPVPQLTLGSHTHTNYDTRSARMVSQAQHRAGLSFRYAEVSVHGKSPRNGGPGPAGGRRRDSEQRLREHLQALGFRPSLRQSQALPADSAEMFELDGSSAWVNFVEQQLPRLRKLGWEIQVRPGFHFDLSPVQGWYADVDETEGHGRFNLELGIEVDDQRVSLLPVLLEMLRRSPGGILRRSRQERQDGQVHLQLTAKRRCDGSPLQVMLPYDHLRPVLALLNDFALTAGGGQLSPGRPTLHLAKPDAARLQDLRPLPLVWRGGQRLREFARRLRDFRRLPARQPTGLRAQLRPYQQEGLIWMQTLRELGVGGILGDDMGLGKTLQTLAHVLLEKEGGRLRGPSLVVMPTSLIFNWLDEAQRFAPQLRVAALHGPQRQQIFDNFADYDLLLSTYSLLPRDIPLLRAKSLDLLIFDEAQYLKNPSSKAAVAARQLHAGQRLCLTGTPLENHLGELWALFDLLMPGWLGDARQFTRHYRTPIEKQGNGQRLEQLRARIRPFLLRRRKDRVAPELPAKSEFVHWVDLSDAQRERYESLRLAMDLRVREAIDRQGVAKSRMLILDALLKLRLLCCDLRLLGEHGGSEPSGKLTLLMDMLETLLASGRRVLLFSQFTSMLALIEQALRRRGLPYLLLTGDTQDRRGPVQRFQNHETPLFLISLKAGGTGLNLTAADTVIHYDPWWNPAVQNQATDRAYRIGQDKPVFVYQLITQGTVEERIHQLQQRKSELARNILENPAHGDWYFDEEDIETLFAPLPD